MVSLFAGYPAWVFCIVIFVCKVIEVSLSSLKTVFLVKGEKLIATVLAFIECMVWGFVVSGIIDSLGVNMMWLMSYCVGYALGYLVGSIIENKLAIGTMDVQLIVDKGDAKAIEDYLASKNYGYFAGERYSKSGPVECIDTVIPRKLARSTRKDIESICKEHVFVMNYDVCYTHGGYNVRSVK